MSDTCNSGTMSSYEIAQIMRECDAYQRFITCNYVEEVDALLDDMDPNWRETVIPDWVDEEAAKECAICCIQATVRRFLVRKAYTTNIFTSRYRPLHSDDLFQPDTLPPPPPSSPSTPPPPPLSRAWATASAYDFYIPSYLQPPEPIPLNILPPVLRRSVATQ